MLVCVVVVTIVAAAMVIFVAGRSRLAAEMMAGEEGISRYISGWHRGKTGKIEKLVAYILVPSADYICNRSS